MTKLSNFRPGLGRLVRGLVLLLPALLIPHVDAAEPKRVLIIHSFGRDYAPFNSTGSALRTELASRLTGSVVFNEVSFDVERGGPPVDDQPFIEFLLHRYRDTAPDLVVTVGAPALRFHLRARPRLFPQTPLLATGIDQRWVEAAQLSGRDRAVSGKLDFPGIVRGILELLPQTKVLALVVGASEHEQFWLKELLRELGPFSGRVGVLPLDALTLEQLRERVAALVADSAVLYFLYSVGPDGVPQENELALAAVNEASNSPVFGLYESQLGGGIVGGVLYDFRRMGTLAGQMGHRMLVAQGEAPANVVMEVEAPQFDWRQLKRWGIPESRLPPGAIVRYRQPTLWEAYRWHVTIVVALVFAQAALIAALLAQRRVRRRAEFELRESEQRMSLVASATGLGMWVHDIPHQTFWANPQQFALLGIPASELYDLERFLQAVHADDRAALGEAIARARESGGEYDVRYRVPLANGAVRWVTARGRGELDARGRPVRMRGVTADDTARVEAGIEARRHENELAHLSRVAMLGQLSGSLAHELNQPLTAILSNAQAALRFLNADGADLQEIREILADIVADDQRAGNVIRRLRALFERGEANQEPLDLNELIREILRILHSDLVSRNISVATDLEPSLPLVHGDRIQLQQLMLNLAVNASEAMADIPAGERRLLFRTKSENGEVVVSVTDHGEGIAPDQVERIFEPFVTNKSYGIGLGLAIGRSIVTAHGGRLWATGNSDRGATFSFSLPAQDSASASKQQADAGLTSMVTSFVNAPGS